MSDKLWEVEIERINNEVQICKQKLDLIENNHLKHIHEDIDKLHNKIDKVLYAILGGLGATILTLIGLLN